MQITPNPVLLSSFSKRGGGTWKIATHCAYLVPIIQYSWIKKHRLRTIAEAYAIFVQGDALIYMQY